MALGPIARLRRMGKILQVPLVGALLVCLFLLGGCDPGIYLRPTDWNEISPMVRGTQIGVVELQAHDVGGLIGQTYSDLNLTIIDPQRIDFAIEGVRLRTKDKEYTAKVGKVYQRRDDPDYIMRQSFFWNFDETLDKVFGKTGELDLDISEALSRRTVIVDLERCLPGNC